MAKAAGRHKLPMTDADLIQRDSCPICRGQNLTEFCSRAYDATQMIRHVRCENCGLIFMSPLPRQEWYDRLYREEFWEVKSGKATDIDVWLNKKQWHKGLARAQKFIDLLESMPGERRLENILEIGTSFGLIAGSIAKHFNGKAYGVEPNHRARTFAEKVSEVSMVSETITELDEWQPNEQVDLVIFSHVLENIVDIESALIAIRSKMREGALLLIETPNVDWQPSMSIYHPYCFSRSSLTYLLGRLKFRILRSQISGRPSMLITPRYLTVLAEKASSDVESKTSLPTASTLGTRFRHFVVKALNHTPIGKLNSTIAWKKYEETPAILGRITDLSEKAKGLR